MSYYSLHTKKLHIILEQIMTTLYKKETNKEWVKDKDPGILTARISCNHIPFMNYYN